MKRTLFILPLAFLVVTFQTVTAQKVEDFIVPILGGKIDEVKKLIKEGVNVNEKFDWGATGDITAMVFAVMLGRMEICNVLIDAGADVNIKTSGGLTLLHHGALSSGDYKDVVELLIAKGLDVNAKCTSYGESKDATPLHAAAGKGNVAVVEVLIKNGAEVNSRAAYNSYIPLHIAARDGHLEVAKILITNEADINAKSKYEETPLDLAISNEHKELADLLRKNGGISGKK